MKECFTGYDFNDLYNQRSSRLKELLAERQQLEQILLDRGWTRNHSFYEPPHKRPKVQDLYTLVAAIEFLVGRE
jgi:hypothetical protein